MSLTDMTRRSFTKLAVLASAAAAVGVTADAIMPTDKVYAAGEDEVVEQKTFCRACPRDCGVIATVRNGVVEKLRGNPDDIVSGGRMCAKGLSGIQALYHPNRTKYPMKRIGERGVDNTWERISWEEAVDMVASALDNMAKKTGRNGLLVTCGGGGNPKFNDTLAFMYYWGAGNTFEPGAAQCSMPRTFTSSGMMGSADRPGAIGDAGGPDVFNPNHPSPCAVLWGAGPASCSPAQFGRNYVRMRENGGKTIVVDPRFSTDAARADVWLPLRAGTDTCMMNAWIKWLIDNDKYDREFVEKWTSAPFLINPDDKACTLLRASQVKGIELPKGETYVYYDKKKGVSRAFALGPDNEADYNPEIEGVYDVELNDGRTVKCKTTFTLLREHVEQFTLEYAAEVCHSPLERIQAALDLFGNAPAGRSIVSGVSIDQTINSCENSIAMCILDILVGCAFKPGSGNAKGPAVPSKAQRYTWGTDKGLFSNMPRTERGRFNPNIDKDKKPKRYEKDSYGNPRPLAEDGLPEPFEFYGFQSAVERFGYVEHKGLGFWAQCLNAGAAEAMSTGDPYPVKVWIERAGNKFATTADMGAWLEGIKNLDFAAHHYMYPTSFTFEVADVILPTCEWLETTQRADPHGTITGMKAAPTVLFEHCDDRFIYGTYFKCLADNYHDERAYHVIYDDDEYYTIYDYDEYLEDLCATDNKTGEKLTWEQTKAIGAYAAFTYDDDGNRLPQEEIEEQYWATTEATYDAHLKVGEDGLYTGLPGALPFLSTNWMDIKDSPRKQMLTNDFLVFCGRYGNDAWGEMPPASEDYYPLPIYREPADSADPEIKAKYPLSCSNGRIPFFHHATLRNAPFLRETYPIPEFWIDPEAAAERGIQTGDWVNIKSARCETSEAIKDGIYAVAWVTDGMARGCTFMERFWNPEFLEPGQDGRKSWTLCSYNALARRVGPYNPAIGSYTLRGIQVEVTKASKPEGIWYEAEDFEPWMPQPSENTGGGYNR